MYNIRYILPAERTWKYDTPVAVSISSAQILFPKFYSAIKETGLMEKWLLPSLLQKKYTR